MKILADENGQSTVIVALFLAIIFCAMAGLAVDAGMIYRVKRVVQQAADAAAIAASAQGATTTATAQAAALAAAKQQGGINAATVSVVPTVVSAGNSDIQVIVTQPTNTVFMGVFSSAYKTINVSAFAEASKPPQQSCVIATGASITGSGSWAGVSGSILASNSGNIDATNCGICAAASIDSIGSWSPITATSLTSTGGTVTNATATNGSITQDGGTCVNPFAPTVPTFSGGCNANDSLFAGPTYVSTLTLPPNNGGPAYCNFITTHVGNLTLTPGLYIFSGTFDFGGGGTLSCPTCTGGAGVTLYFPPGTNLNGGPDGGLNEGFTNGTTITLTAATTAGATNGAIPGIAIWDGNTTPASPDSLYFGGGTNTVINGAFYAPNTIVYMSNYGRDTINGSFVVADLLAGGSGGLVLNGTASGPAAGGVTLVK
jgi:Flp pilus assembly protein TadG